MTAMRSVLGVDLVTKHPLRDAFLKWQCRVRHMAMRDGFGRPDDGVMPALTLPGADAPMGHIITVLNKTPSHSATPEMMHMAKRTFDPAQRREKALEYFSNTYYQKTATFADILTASFPAHSEGAKTIRRAETCTLCYDAFGQKFDLTCRIWRLAPKNPFYQSTWWHNHLFNPSLEPDAVILGFEPDWDQSSATPEVRQTSSERYFEGRPRGPDQQGEPK